MVKVVGSDEGRDLKLPGRHSLELVSGLTGSKSVTLRLVEIPVPSPGDKPRDPHRHQAFEECMYVLAGEGVTQSPTGNVAVRAGDTILVPAGEYHVTRNTGNEPLRLLCFFPTADCSEQK